MNALLEKLIEEKQTLQTTLVQIQSMLHVIDGYISEELLKRVVEGKDKPDGES